MSWTADGAARSIEHDEQPPERGQELEDQLSQEQFNDELQKDLEVMLTQEELCEEEGGPEGREGREGETDEGKEEDDDEGDAEDAEGGYSSPDFPPTEPRRRPMEDELDKDFNPDDEVGMMPYYLENLANTLAVLPLLTH